MKMRTIVTLLIFTALGSSAVFGAEVGRPYIGIMLDPEPLSELLVKHLRLDEGEGARLVNVVVGGAGDNAGLRRDDIIVSFEGVRIDGAEMLIEELNKHEVGQETTLEIIRLGRRKLINVKLGRATYGVEWKYPVEPGAELQWQPGRVFWLRPGQKEWMGMPFHEFMTKSEMATDDVDPDVTKFFAERYSFQYSEDGHEYQITIEGDPQDEDAVMAVKIGDEVRRVNIKDVDTLPDKYRKFAEDTLDKAKRGRGRGAISIQIGPDGRRISDNPTTSDLPRLQSQRFDRLERRLQQLQDRLELLEKQRHGATEEPEQKPKKSSNSIGVGIMLQPPKKT